MLCVGIIGYGSRVSHMARGLGVFGVPYRVAAIADPRDDEIQGADDGFLADTVFYPDADTMLAEASLDGVMIGTRCLLHSDMAAKVAPHDVPLFLEKPVAINFRQIKDLDRAFKQVSAPTVVSFPLRLSPIVQRVGQLLAAGEIGTVEQVVASNDVPYGSTYYRHWYRNYGQVGGLWLQKATHDFDYISYLLDSRPRIVATMHSQRVYGGSKPFDLRCGDCDEQESCPESPFSLFHQGFVGDAVDTNSESMCMFSDGIANQDSGNALLEYESGVQVSYSQNFFARFRAARRGARLYGYSGTIDFDWYENTIKLYRHRSPVVETIDFVGDMPHFGGDRELCLDFVRAMRDDAPSRSPIQAGIDSVLACLWARESAASQRFCEVVMPDEEEIPSLDRRAAQPGVASQSARNCGEKPESLWVGPGLPTIPADSLAPG